MYYVYILLSLKDSNFYTGVTNNVKRRIKDHNSNQVTSTKNRGPFKLVYFEGSLNIGDAYRIETYLKTSWGKRYIKNRMKEWLTKNREVPIG